MGMTVAWGYLWHVPISLILGGHHCPDGVNTYRASHLALVNQRGEDEVGLFGKYHIPRTHRSLLRVTRFLLADCFDMSDTCPAQAYFQKSGFHSMGETGGKMGISAQNLFDPYNYSNQMVLPSNMFPLHFFFGPPIPPGITRAHHVFSTWIGHRRIPPALILEWKIMQNGICVYAEVRRAVT
ncbi:uncharacterized protein LACBIDRAFT_335493 [Laccaria bicolor S238N-H82]|uniref:Predicted protein n=1 Tax=Laccaria bicolor (strain S238N-H82 / ATCC MYA-4686) TaxID=486041 RepID=B0E2F7_LACBS|nr:uncharacterized protein LACBIDRAFT_335493 [Laccaria bicolor S238N-H82]EDQ98987.1 predicted protein [Laccaria bicolor S238N-H82]|eukprot:XP_001890389.1 predicted protein [Laccaria bicolor S238N-H82]